MKEIRCQRCGDSPATALFSTCAHADNVPVCLACDLELNRLLLRELRVRGAAKKFAAYQDRPYREVRPDDLDVHNIIPMRKIS